MSIADQIAGTWISDADMNSSANIYGLKYWAPGAAVGDNIEGTYRGHWPTHGGVKPQGLHWFYPTQKEADQ